jgi:hypothetical protein
MSRPEHWNESKSADALKGLASFVAICLAIALGYCTTLPGKPPPGHGHGKPTPSPTITPVPSPSPSATPSPSVTPAPTPIPTVTLAWDAPADPSVTGYHLWFGFAPGAESTPIDTGPATVWTIEVQSATTYYFVVTAYNTNGDSVPSNEISYTSP